MRHHKHQNKLGVSPSHRKSLVRNLAISLIDNGKIKTTTAKARATRSFVEKLVTIARNDSVANRRLVFSRLGSKKAVQKLFNEVAPQYKERPGGYTRILKLPDTRVGDGANMSYIAFVQ